jgi:hypothetical protein
VREELVHSVDSVRLNGVIGREYHEHGDFRLQVVNQKKHQCEQEGKDGRRTAFKPPGGLVLAQLQLGSLHLAASHEYPAASELDVGPLMDPSCAHASSGGRRERISELGTIPH